MLQKLTLNSQWTFIIILITNNSLMGRAKSGGDYEKDDRSFIGKTADYFEKMLIE